MSSICSRTNELYILIDPGVETYYENGKPYLPVGLTRCCELPFSIYNLYELLKLSLDEIFNLPVQTHNNKKHVVCNDNCCFKEIKKVYLGIMNICNLKCYHCSALFDKKTKINNYSDLLFKFLEKLKNANLDLISFDNSGEIFLAYDRLVEYLKSISPQTTKNIKLITNGTLATRERLKELKQISNETDVQYQFIFSIDGITKETYEATRVGSNFKEVINNLMYCSGLFCDTIVSFTIKETNKTDAENIEKIKRFFRPKCHHIFFNIDIYDQENMKQYFPTSEKWR